MSKFTGYSELVLSQNRSEDSKHLQFTFGDRMKLWQKSRELNMSVADMRECESAASHYEEAQKAAAAAEKARKAAEKKAAADKAAAEKAAKKEKERKEKERIRPLSELLEDGLVKIPNKDLYIGKTQVTQALWELITGTNPSHFIGEDRPVEMVSRTDCLDFIDQLNSREEVVAKKWKFRLPTKDEWGAAASAQGKKKDNASASNTATAWCWDNANYETHSVAQKKPSALGLFDLFGNVAEWCAGSCCIGGCFLSEFSDCNDAEQYGDDDKSPAIGLRLIAYRV